MTGIDKPHLEKLYNERSGHRFEAHIVYDPNVEFPYRWSLRRYGKFDDFTVIDQGITDTEEKAIKSAQNSANEHRKSLEYGTKVIEL